MSLGTCGSGSTAPRVTNLEDCLPLPCSQAWSHLRSLYSSRQHSYSLPAVPPTHTVCPTQPALRRTRSQPGVLRHPKAWKYPLTDTNAHITHKGDVTTQSSLLPNYGLWMHLGPKMNESTISHSKRATLCQSDVWLRQHLAEPPSIMVWDFFGGKGRWEKGLFVLLLYRLD